MSIFTRIFVVLVMILSVLLVGLIVPFVKNVDTYKQRWQDQLARANSADLAAKIKDSELAASKDTHNKQLEQLNGENARLQAMLAEKDQTLSSQQAQIVTLSNANDDVRSQLASLAAAEKLNSELLSLLKNENASLSEQALEATKKNVELAEKLNEKTTEADTLTRQVRLYAEQIKDLEDQNRDLAQKADLGRSPSAAKPQVTPLDNITRGISPDKPIRAMVTGVSTIGDEVFVQINVGTNDGVREEMKFMIYRGNEYLGDMLVTLVDLNEAAGRVVLKKGTITAGEAQAVAGGTP